MTELRFDGRVVVVTGAGRGVGRCHALLLGAKGARVVVAVTSYGAAKGAVFGLTRNLATEDAALGIRVNAVAPRAYTRMSASHSDKLAAHLSMPKEVMDQINAAMPPEMCAPAVAFLAHESCRVTDTIGIEHEEPRDRV